uniref:Uncharacterized protein n=1 Tax=Nelumbo nucifera TaxID=4432 RepID=A0A822YFU6_NELNU|nr:TPA_asm: hypothetical protein HUJ06_009894 [Nelumbo nucifera]
MVIKSRVAWAKMSAQDTTPGQVSSRAVLARTMRSKASPGRERFTSLSRSALLKALEEMRTEASQPSTMQSWKKRRRVPAAVVGLVICLLVTISRMVSSNWGHDLL